MKEMRSEMAKKQVACSRNYNDSFLVRITGCNRLLTKIISKTTAGEASHRRPFSSPPRPLFSRISHCFNNDKCFSLRFSDDSEIYFQDHDTFPPSFT